MTKQIYMTRPIHEAGMIMLREKGYEITTGDAGHPPLHDAIVSSLASKPYDAVVAFLTDSVDATLFKVCPTAKIFANYSVGFNNVRLDEAKEFGITITNTPGCASLAVAEHAVALMLCLTTRMLEGDEFMKSGKFKGWQPDLLIGTDLSKKTVGLIGLGEIGMDVAKILYNGFGCNILYTDIKPKESFEKEDHAIFVTKEELLQKSDIVSLHVPLIPETKHLINDHTIEMMKKTAILINTARGPIVDEKALIRALQEKRIAGVGLDVFEFEPNVVEGLVDFPNVVLTPHIASARESVRIRMSEIVAQNIISFLETGKAVTPVN